jgi:Flp pilus assembly pilin Flp
MQSATHPVRRLARDVARFLADTRGATAIEYALIASCIGALLAAVFVVTGNDLRDNIYQKIYDAYPS